MHAKFGPIFSFWLHRQYYVSIASHKLFKEHSRVFDKPGGWDFTRRDLAKRVAILQAEYFQVYSLEENIVQVRFQRSSWRALWK